MFHRLPHFLINITVFLTNSQQIVQNGTYYERKLLSLLNANNGILFCDQDRTKKIDPSSLYHRVLITQMFLEEKKIKKELFLFSLEGMVFDEKLCYSTYTYFSQGCSHLEFLHIWYALIHTSF